MKGVHPTEKSDARAGHITEDYMKETDRVKGKQSYPYFTF